MEKLAPFSHSNMFVAVAAIVLIWTVSYIFPIATATEKVSACNPVTHDCLLQCHCEKNSRGPHHDDTFQFRVPIPE